MTYLGTKEPRSVKILFQGRLEMFPGRNVLAQLGMFQGQYTVQVAPQTALYDSHEQSARHISAIVTGHLGRTKQRLGEFCINLRISTPSPFSQLPLFFIHKNPQKS